MSIEKSVKKVEEVYQNRVEKYVEKIEDKPKMKNQLLVKEGKAVLILNGTAYPCTHLEGYVKLPNCEYIQIVNQMTIGFFILPKERIIITEGGNNYFLGYKSNNSTGCLVLIHAITEVDDVLIVSFNETLPVLILMDYSEEHETSINSSIFGNMEYLFNMTNKVDVLVEEIDEEKDDNWE